MIRHIVLFKLKAFESETAKTEKLTQIKTSLEALTAKVAVIKALEVGINTNPKEEYDIALRVDLDSMEDLEIYAKHPDHLVTGAIIREVMQGRACVDFEL